ncbi:MAG: carbohydrate kinase, partial [Spirochaetales bacterium]|nr:carbohydrate kinase [Spirochaetales bacterium]
STIYHLAGLFRGEIPDDFIPYLTKKGKVGIDAQGLLRCREEGKLLFKDWASKKELLPLISYLKTDAAEAEILTGEADREKAAYILASWGAKEVMITHNTEVIVLVDGKIHRAPFTPSNLSGRTGRGDTTFAAYLAWRLDHDPEESVHYAAALCSIKMESPGPFADTVEDVITRMEEDW